MSTPTESETEAVVVPRRHGNGRRRGVQTRRAGTLQFGHWWWALPGIALVVGIHFVATVVGGTFAFTNWAGVGAFDWIGFDNFIAIVRDPRMIGALVNTLFLAIGSVLLQNVIGLAIALGLNRLVKTRYALRTLFFMPMVLSPLAVSYIWKFIFDYDGPINAVLAAVGLEEWVRPWLADPSLAIWAVLVVFVWQQTGFAMVIYIAGLAAVPPEIEEAAAIDGANQWRRFWHVVLPAIRPAVAIATTLGIIHGLRIFDQIMALTEGGPAGATETLATQVYKQAFSLGNFGYGAALALLLAAIILIFAIIQQRLTAGRPEEA